MFNLAVWQGLLEFLDAGICDLGAGEYQPFKIGLPKGVGDPKKTDAVKPRKNFTKAFVIP